jgi:hypothetical protein
MSSEGIMGMKKFKAVAKIFLSKSSFDEETIDADSL